MDELAGLVGKSVKLESVRQSIRRIVARDFGGQRPPAVLIQGETGTGKGLVAGILHRLGPRSQGPFVDVNCAAIPDTLLEAELFGFEQGAFTDARRAKAGLFQTAHRGTVFLDEIGLLPEGLQAKLLKVIEERTVRRLGTTRLEPADVWVISATNTDLAGAAREKRFRADLYHRLAVIPIVLPPLRDRGDDVILLAEQFLARVCTDYGLPPKRLSDEAAASLRAYQWPGNVRELINVIERVALLGEGAVVSAEILPIAELASVPPPASSSASPGGATHHEAMRQHYVAVLAETGWNLSRAAAILAVSRNTLRARMDRLGIKAASGRGRAARPGGISPRVHSNPAAPVGTAAVVPLAPAFSQPAVLEPSSIRWERRWVTTMRVALGDPGGAIATWAPNRALELLSDKVLGFGGRLETLSQTTINASFGLEPIDEAPRRAALAAMAIQKAVSPTESGGRALPIKVAIHTSVYVIAYVSGGRRPDPDAERLSNVMLEDLISRAPWGTIAISSDSEPFLDRRFRLEALDKGSAPAAFVVIGHRATGLAVRGAVNRFVGRHHELELLENRWTLAGRGHGQVVAIVGDAGVGKSRLVWEFINRPATAQRSVRLQAGSSAVSSPTPYLPVVDLLKAYFEIDPEEGGDRARERVTDRLLGLDRALAPALPALTTLLDLPMGGEPWNELDAADRRARIQDAIKRLLVRQSREQALLLVFEDAHWIDSESQGVLDALVESLPTACILLLVVYRPEYRHGWASKGYYTQIRVDPLSPGDSERLLDGLIGEREAVLALKPLLLERTEGNPFFIEESVRALAETGTLVGAPGRYQVVNSAPHIDVPATVYEVLAARIDRLPQEEKRILHCASVVGKDVSVEILAGIVGLSSTALEPILAHLRGADFLYETGGVSGPEYTFTHTLTHEVAYSSIIDGERRAAHARTVEVIEALRADRLSEHVEDLARHSFHGEAWEKAVDYLGRAAARALARSANREAAALLEQALTAVAHLPRDPHILVRAVDLQFELRNVLQALGEFKAMRERLAVARTDVEALGDRRRLGRLSAYLADNYRMTGEHDRAVEWGERALTIADSLADLELQVTANTYLGQISLAGGGYREAITRFTRNIEALTGDQAVMRFGSPQPRSIHSRTCLAWCLAELGEFLSARAVGEEAVELARSLNHPLSLVTAYFGLGYLFVRKGDLTDAVTILEPALEMTRAAHSPVWFPRIASLLGGSYGLAGRPHQGRPLLEEALERSSAMHLVSGRSLILVWLAESWMAAGDLERAREIGTQALGLAREHKEQGHEAWALYTIGRLAARIDPLSHEEATRLIDHALRLATELSMRPLAAHCHVVFGQIRAVAGDQLNAKHHLAAGVDLLRELGMEFWRPEAEADLHRLG
jgi:transcriptional regulator with AAA-type ATPase domain/tetratricopeptide (TPR) repeat protein